MKIKYNRKIGVVLIIPAVITLSAGLLVLALGGIPAAVVPGAIGLVVSVCYLKNPYFGIEDGELVLYHLFGFRAKTYPVRRLADLQVEAGKLVLGDGHTSERLPISRLLAHPGDWRELAHAIVRDREARV